MRASFPLLLPVGSAGVWAGLQTRGEVGCSSSGRSVTGGEKGSVEMRENGRCMLYELYARIIAAMAQSVDHIEKISLTSYAHLMSPSHSPSLTTTTTTSDHLHPDPDSLLYYEYTTSTPSNSISNQSSIQPSIQPDKTSIRVKPYLFLPFRIKQDHIGVVGLLKLQPLFASLVRYKFRDCCKVEDPLSLMSPPLPLSLPLHQSNLSSNQGDIVRLTLLQGLMLSNPNLIDTGIQVQGDSTNTTNTINYSGCSSSSSGGGNGNNSCSVTGGIDMIGSSIMAHQMFYNLLYCTRDSIQSASMNSNNIQCCCTPSVSASLGRLFEAISICLWRPLLVSHFFCVYNTRMTWKSYLLGHEVAIRMSCSTYQSLLLQPVYSGSSGGGGVVGSSNMNKSMYTLLIPYIIKALLPYITCILLVSSPFGHTLADYRAGEGSGGVFLGMYRSTSTYSYYYILVLHVLYLQGILFTYV